MPTASAPRASATNTSAPERMPLSKSTGTSDPAPRTASTTPGSASSAATERSTCRPPWFDTRMPSTPSVDRAACVVGVQHALEHHGQAGQLAQAGQVGPAERGLGEHVEEGLDRGPGLGCRQVAAGVAGVVAAQRDQRAHGGGGRSGLRLRLGLRRGGDPLLDEPAEDRVGGVLRDALPARERQVAEVEVARPPAEVGRVEGDHDRLAAARLGPSDQARGQVVVAAPVELVPVPEPPSAAATSSIGTTPGC